MKVKTETLIGKPLDWAVAKAIGEYRPVPVPAYSTDPAQGQPILERNGISVVRGNDLHFPKGNEKGEYTEKLWLAYYPGRYRTFHGPTMLIAGLRNYVTKELGDEIDIPDEVFK